MYLAFDVAWLFEIQLKRGGEIMGYPTLFFDPLLGLWITIRTF